MVSVKELRRSSDLARVLERVPLDAWPLLAIAGAVFVANLAYVVGIFDPNPLGPRSGLVSAISHGPAPGFSVLDLNDGLISQAVGHRAMLDWLHLQVPWWNPYEGTGMPLAGEMQAAAFFPPTLLTLFAGGQLYEHMFLELLTGVFTFLLLRRLSLSRTVSAAAAIAFGLNGTFAWFGHAPVNPIAFLPLLLLGFEMAYGATVEGRRGGWWLIGVAGALSVYAGFPETTYIDSLFAGCWLAWRAGCLGWDRLRPFAAKVAAGALVGALLAAPLLIAFGGYINHADVGVHGGLVGKLAIQPRGLSMSLMPYVFGPIFAFSDRTGVVTGLWKSVGGYLTTSLLLFALFALLSKRRRGLKIILVAWLVLAVARIYDEPHLLGQVLGVLPGMSRVAFYRYAFPSLELAVVVLAALGIQDLVSDPARRARVALAALLTAALVVAATAGATPIDHRLGSGHSLYSHVSAIWAVSIVAIGAGSALIRNVRRRVGLIAVLIAIDSIALFVAPELSAPRSVKLDLAPAAYLQRHLGLQRFFTIGPIQPNYGTYFGIAELDSTDVPPSNFAKYVNSRLDPYTDPTAFFGNNYSGRPPTAPPTSDELIANLAGFRDAGVAYVLAPARPSPASQHHLVPLAFRSPSTWIYRLHGAAPYFSVSNHSCNVHPRDRQSVQLVCPSPTVLLRRETDLSGWSAKVDGRPTKVRLADRIFQAIDVAAGTHRITFSYTPPGEGWGLAALLAGIACLGGAAASRASTRRQRPSQLHPRV